MVVKKPTLAEDFGRFIVFILGISIFVIIANVVYIYLVMGPFKLTSELFVFGCATFIFQIVSLAELWILYNLVKGRYSYDAFEERWECIIAKIGQISHQNWP
jgi:hypothetical protein